MSEESAPSPEPPLNSDAAGTPRVRRISNPRPKKPAKAVQEPEDTVGSSAPVAPEPLEPAAEETTSGSDWPEFEAASPGSASSAENPKRKRRRKKGKGNGSQNTIPPADGESFQLAPGEAVQSGASQTLPQGQPPRPAHPPRPKPDPELLARFAWKIYLSEVSEEGVALVGDNDAKELSRRCFRLAEIFLEEQARRR